jgi:fucose permease
MTEISSQLRSLKYYTLFGFFVIGVVTVLLGQVLPVLSGRLNLNDAQAGSFFLAQFAGSATGTLIVGKLSRRFGFVVVTLIGLGAMIAGVPGLDFADFYLCWLSIFLYGAGLGMTIPAINLLTIDITPDHLQSSSINLINFAWGIGAICSRPFVALVSAGDSLVAVTLLIDLALAALVVCFLLSLRNLDTRKPAEIDPLPIAPLWRRPRSWLFLLFGFFVIGIESGLGGWLTTYSESLNATAPAFNATVAFFAFLVLGRGVASIVSRRLSENMVISICVVTLFTGIFLIVFDEAHAVVGACVAGLGASAIFPTNMVRFTRAFGAAATQRAAPLFISGICGAATLSWLTGLVSTSYGGLRLGLGVLLVSAIFVMLLHAVIVIVFRRAV